MKSHMTAENNDTAIEVYLREIGHTPLLTPQWEIELAAKVKSGDRKARRAHDQLEFTSRCDNRTALCESRSAAS